MSVRYPMYAFIYAYRCESGGWPSERAGETESKEWAMQRWWSGEKKGESVVLYILQSVKSGEK